MSHLLNDEAQDLLFREAHNYIRWLDKAVNNETLRALYDLMKLAPTFINCNPVRIIPAPTPAIPDSILMRCASY